MKSSRGFTIIEVIVVMAVFLFIIGAAIGIFLSVVLNQKAVLAEQQLINQVSYAEEYMSKAMRMAVADTSGNCLGQDSLGNSGYIYLLTRYDGSLHIFRGIRFLNQSTGYCQEFFIDNSTPALDGSNTPLNFNDPNNPVVLKELKGKNNDGVVDTTDTDAVPITSSALQFDPENPARFSINGSSGSTFASDRCTGPLHCGISNLDATQPMVTMLFNILVPSAAGTGAMCSTDATCKNGAVCSASKCIPVTAIQTTVSERNINANIGQRQKQ